MIDYFALAVVVIVSLYFIGLGSSSLLAPAFAKRFLLGFAESAAAHYTELAARLVVGLAFLVQAPKMRFSTVFTLFGWLLIFTTVCLLLVPWQWHQRFARQTVPQALRFLRLIGVCSLGFGGFILLGVAGGPVA